MIKWAGHVTCSEEINNLYKNLVDKPEQKKSFGIFRCGWECNIKIGLKLVGCEGGDGFV
jgi:hypothetical protein